MMKQVKQSYQAILDTSDTKGRFWMSGNVRRLTEDEAKPYLEKRKICLWIKPEPKRFVMLDGIQMSWGAYLKYRYSLKRKVKS